MDIKNLHSVLSSPWLITDQAEKALMPVLINILQKGEIKEEKQELILTYYSTEGILNRSGYSEEETPDNSVVAVLPIKGAIIKYSDWCTTGTKGYTEKLERWKNNQAIAGVVLDIDSGGGTVAGTPEFAEYIKNYPKPIVAYTDGMMASAAYYLASPANKIIANPYADIIGSIGTMFKGVVLDGYYEKMGAQIIEAYATQSTQKNIDIREALNKENPSTERLIKEWLDPLNQRFIDFVSENRPKLSKEATTGKHYVTSQDALKNGLIDSIGTLQDAVNTVFELSEKESNNTNNEDMSEKTYPKIAAALGLTEIAPKGGFLFGSKSVSLSEDQLDTLEASLSADQSAVISQLEKDKKDKETEVQAEKTKNSDLANVVKQSLKDCKLESTGTTEGDIKLLTEKVTEYGKLDGEQSTTIHSKGDKADTELSPEEAILNKSIIKE